MTVTSLPKSKIDQLIKAGEQFKIPFHLPPFDGDAAEGFYDIDTLRKTKKIKDFISIIDGIGVKYEYAYKKDNKKKVFMVIKMRS